MRDFCWEYARRYPGNRSSHIVNMTPRRPGSKGRFPVPGHDPETVMEIGFRLSAAVLLEIGSRLQHLCRGNQRHGGSRDGRSRAFPRADAPATEMTGPSAQMRQIRSCGARFRFVHKYRFARGIRPVLSARSIMRPGNGRYFLMPQSHPRRQHIGHGVAKGRRRKPSRRKSSLGSDSAYSTTRRSSSGNTKAKPWRAPVCAHTSARSAICGLVINRQRFSRPSGAIPWSSAMARRSARRWRQDLQARCSQLWFCGRRCPGRKPITCRAPGRKRPRHGKCSPPAIPRSRFKCRDLACQRTPASTQKQFGERAPAVERRAFVAAPARQHQADALFLGAPTDSVFGFVRVHRYHLSASNGLTCPGEAVDGRIGVQSISPSCSSTAVTKLVSSSSVMSLRFPIEKRIGVEHAALFAQPPRGQHGKGPTNRAHRSDARRSPYCAAERQLTAWSTSRRNSCAAASGERLLFRTAARSSRQ